MQKFVAYLPNGELFDAKYALLQFASVVSDEKHLVAIETEAEIEDVDAALAKTGMPYLLLSVTASTGRNGDNDLLTVMELVSRSP
ncbi:hypothetical protein [Rhizobium sp. BG4]|uniref:hypothetical protein n=1 Tax=Rhizobium sp. BG4 TaxID=2613770 RepID=UPI00193DC3F8|nr:hypothetical protein [Rhizobium sp. BG4]QRM45795.1 hypothetical protein F2982_20430 [Rhizobium sp. BG4]